ncbi:MAG: hypothetical protein AB7O24_04870 [Kofleriaceae bacterium]
MLASLASALVWLSLAACGGDAGTESISKEEAAGQQGKSDDGVDLCEVLGWYGDNVCDTFCPSPDPDCGCAAICGGARESKVCVNDAACLQSCATLYDNAPQAQKEAFVDCITNDPLCFKTAEQCVGSEPALDCDSLCAGARESKVCFSDAACLASCQGLQATDAQQGAYATCVLDDPLCFVTAEQCAGI